MPTNELLRLLQRHAALERGLRGRGGIKVTEERELLKLRQALDAHSGAVEVLLAVARRAGRLVEEITIDDLQILG
jgi:hypothetical protein